MREGVKRERDNRAALAVIYVYAAAASALTVKTRRWFGLVASGRLIGLRSCARTHERAHCVLQHPSEATGYRRWCATLSPCTFLPSTDSGGCNPSSLRLYCPWALSDRSSLSTWCSLCPSCWSLTCSSSSSLPWLLGPFRSLRLFFFVFLVSFLVVLVFLSC